MFRDGIGDFFAPRKNLADQFVDESALNRASLASF
jgi:hypothetical protein